VRANRPRGVAVPARSSTELDKKHGQLISAFAAATLSGDLAVLKQLLTSDARLVTDGGGKVRGALEVVEGADHVARAAVEGAATRKRPDTWWRPDFRMRWAIVNGLPAIVIAAPEGVMQTAAFEIEGDRIRAMYVVRNPDKLRHLATAGRPQAQED
jgi:RNA polymerase sigma-70 factor (ECF subfamily)